jgi:hypothetical protein
MADMGTGVFQIQILARIVLDTGRIQNQKSEI